MQPRKSAQQSPDSMPGIIIEKKVASHENTGFIQKKRKIILWISVFIVGSVVFVMWFLNMTTLFFDFKNFKQPKTNLFVNAKEEFNKSLNEVMDTENGKEQIIEQIGQIIKEMVSSTQKIGDNTTNTLEINSTTTLNLEE